MSESSEITLIDTYGGEFKAYVEVFTCPAEKTICIVVDDDPQCFHSANLGWEEAKALRNWLNEVLADD